MRLVLRLKQGIVFEQGKLVSVQVLSLVGFKFLCSFFCLFLISFNIQNKRDSKEKDSFDMILLIKDLHHVVYGYGDWLPA